MPTEKGKHIKPVAPWNASEELAGFKDTGCPRLLQCQKTDSCDRSNVAASDQDVVGARVEEMNASTNSRLHCHTPLSLRRKLKNLKLRCEKLSMPPSHCLLCHQTRPQHRLLQVQQTRTPMASEPRSEVSDLTRKVRSPIMVTRACFSFHRDQRKRARSCPSMR